MTWPHWQPYIPLSQHLLASFFHCPLKNLLNIFSLLVWHNKHKSNFWGYKVNFKSSIDALTVITPMQLWQLGMPQSNAFLLWNLACWQMVLSSFWIYQSPHHPEVCSTASRPSDSLRRRLNFCFITHPLQKEVWSGVTRSWMHVAVASSSVPTSSTLWHHCWCYVLPWNTHWLTTDSCLLYHRVYWLC